MHRLEPSHKHMFLSKPIKMEKRKNRILYIFLQIWCLIFIRFNLISFRSQAVTQYLFSWLGPVLANISFWLLQALLRSSRLSHSPFSSAALGDNTFLTCPFRFISEFIPSPFFPPIHYFLISPFLIGFMTEYFNLFIIQCLCNQFFLVIYTGPYAFRCCLLLYGSAKLLGAMISMKEALQMKVILYLICSLLKKVYFRVLQVVSDGF